MLFFPFGSQTVTDARYLSGIFNTEFTDELDRRGYDITTLKFSIEPKKGNQKFGSQRS